MFIISTELHPLNVDDDGFIAIVCTIFNLKKKQTMENNTVKHPVLHTYLAVLLCCNVPVTSLYLLSEILTTKYESKIEMLNHFNTET